MCTEVVHVSREAASPSVDTAVEVVGEQQDGVGEGVLTVLVAMRLWPCGGGGRAGADGVYM